MFLCLGLVLGRRTTFGNGRCRRRTGLRAAGIDLFLGLEINIEYALKGCWLYTKSRCLLMVGRINAKSLSDALDCRYIESSMIIGMKKLVLTSNFETFFIVSFHSTIRNGLVQEIDNAKDQTLLFVGHAGSRERVT